MIVHLTRLATFLRGMGITVVLHYANQNSYCLDCGFLIDVFIIDVFVITSPPMLSMLLLDLPTCSSSFSFMGGVGKKSVTKTWM